MGRTTDFGEQKLDILVLERKTATQHHVQYYSTAPHINFRPCIKPTSDDLRSSVIRAATTGLQEITIFDLVRETKVCDLDVEVVIKENVFWFQIPVHDLQLVTVFDTGDELLEETPGTRFGHAAVRNDVVE